MDSVDKLTLELFTNKTQYKKYLSKSDPDKYRLLEEKREKYEKYKKEILEKTEKMLSFPDLAVSPLVQETFENFVDVLIKEIETNALEVKDFNDSGSDEDVLFKNIVPSPIKRELELEYESESDSESKKKTFWHSNNNNDFFYGEKKEGIFDHYPTNTSVRKRFVGRRNSIFP
jgi:hypothetical protein